MAKTLGPKNTAKQPSSPNKPPPPKQLSPSTNNLLAPRPNAGITKKRKPAKPLSRKQRLRVEQGREKAENVREKEEVKVAGSVGRGERRKLRRREWDDIEGGIEKTGAKKRKRTRTSRKKEVTGERGNDEKEMEDKRDEVEMRDKDGVEEGRDGNDGPDGYGDVDDDEEIL